MPPLPYHARAGATRLSGNSDPLGYSVNEGWEGDPLTPPP